MGLRLGNSLKSSKSPNLGFDLSFTQGKTYNLDELVELRNRTSSTAALVIEVKDEGAIAQKVLDKLINDVSVNIISTLSEKNSDLKNSISNIIRDTYRLYGVDIKGTSNQQLKEKIINDITSKVDRYLRFLANETGISFKVYAEDATGEKFSITADFSSKEVFNEKFILYYNKYASEFQDELKVAEGGLAISNNASRIRVNQSDYEKYLLDDVKTNQKPTNPSYITLSDSKPVVIWTDGSEPTENEEKAQLTDIIINYGYLKNSVLDSTCTVSEVGKSDNSIATVGFVNEKIRNIDNFATIDYVNDEIDKVVGDAKESLDTLKELSDAIGEDPNFVKSITEAINEKASTEYVDDKINEKTLNINKELENKVDDKELTAVTDDVNVLKNNIISLTEKLENLQGGDITSDELNTLKKISEKVKELYRTPLLLNDPDLEL